MSSAHRLETTAVVQLPTWEAYSHIQTVVGKPSSVSSDLEEFRGIPYGTVSGRWEHSQLRTRLPQDVFDATKNGPKCPQPSGPNDSRTFQSYLPFPKDVESEFDCLNLFVIRPSAAALKAQGIDAATTRLPVFVWIHGGGLAFGSATDPMWDPSRLVMRALANKTPIIAVSINYRLNIFGFAASSDLLRSQGPTDLRGLNFGLRDQKVALEWISRNIAAFGGDSDHITIGGQSAGSVSVNCHLLEAETSSSKPLFNRAIMESGAITTLFRNTMEEADKNWVALCNQWNVDLRASDRDKVQLLRRLSPAALLDSVAKLGIWTFPTIVDGFTICAEIGTPGNIKVNLGPVDLRNRPTKSASTSIDVLMGVTDCEAGAFLLPRPLSWDETQAVFDKAYPESTLRSEVMQAYGLVETASAQELKDGLIAFLNDRIFEIPVHLARTSLRNLRRTTDKPEVKSVHSFHAAFGNPFPGPQKGVAHHCVEMIYLFEAFHDALALADQGITHPYQEPDTETTANPGHYAFLKRKDDSESSEPMEQSHYKRTNIELCHAIQDHWLDFMLQDDKSESGLDDITVFGKDRDTVVENLVDTPTWKKRRERWITAARDLDAMARAEQLIRKYS